MTLAAKTLLASHQLAHQLVQAIIADLPPTVAEQPIEGATISRISPILAHAVLGEDMLISTVTSRPTVMDDAWLRRTGAPGPLPAMTLEWLTALYDIDEVKAYVAAVFSRTEQVLAGLTEEALMQTATSPIGTSVTHAELLSSFNLIHLMIHSGEISALKGVQGLPGGLPF